jgi:hypothetical protein
VFLPLLYLCGLVFSLNSHYKLIEEEEKMIHEEIQEMERLSMSKGRGDSEQFTEQASEESGITVETEGDSADLEEMAAEETVVVNFGLIGAAQ